nr:NBS-LRR disease resistance protein [Dasypyrum villosum]
MSWWKRSAYGHLSDHQPRLTRQRRLRHVEDIEVGVSELRLDDSLAADARSSSYPARRRVIWSGLTSASSAPISSSQSSMEVGPARSSSKPMPLPHPLPLPHEDDAAPSSSDQATTDAIWSGLANASPEQISRSGSRMEVTPARSSSEPMAPPHNDDAAYSARRDTVPVKMGGEGLSANGVRLLREGLEGLCNYLKDVPDADLDPGVTPKWWIKEVRELAYDMEDFFDEVMQSGAGAGDGVAVGRSSPLGTTMIGIISKRKQRLPQIAHDFSHLMARLDDARERCKSFQLAPETAIRPDHAQASTSRHTPDLPLDLPVSAVSISNVHVNIAGSSLVGVEQLMKKLVNLLAFGDDKQKQLKIIPISGSAGAGKTMVARTIYHRYGGDFQCRAFVRVSRNPDMRKLLTSILSQTKAPWTHAFSDAQDLIDSIIKHLQGKSYFIVVDDLWASSEWDIISRAFPSGDRCSRILTTTQVEDVALACSDYESEYIFKMRPLNDGESRKLFFNNVFGSEGEGACPKEFEVLADRIIRKCSGLPLSIVNIASLLLPSKWNLAMWEKVESSLPSTLRTDPTSQGMKDVLILTYNNLPLHMKTCLLYLGMYPEGCTIRKDDLVKQWVAECLVSDTDYGCFDELVRRGMIQPVDTNYDGEVLSCTVNHMVMDLIRYKSIEDNFIIAVKYFESTLLLPDKVRRLSLQFGGSKSAKIPESIRMSQVRSLLYCGSSRCVPSILDYCILRVLILHIWADQDQMSFDLTIIDELFRLRYLMVECNITINLPDKIKGLQHLETLQLDGRLSAVPSDIGHLENLRHLCLPSQANLRDLDRLSNLQDLHFTLSTARPIENLEVTMKYLGSILHKLNNLKSIILASAGSSPVNTSSVSISCDGLSNMSPVLAHLERLELLPRICIFPSLPKWFKTLNKLCTLKIGIRELSNSDMEIVNGLPALSALSLYIQTAPAEKIVFGKSGFSALKYFKLRCTEPLLKFEADAMPNLRKLKLLFSVQEVQQHGVAPICIEHLAGLKEISAKIGGAGAAGTESALRISVSNDPKNPKINGQLVNWDFCSDEDRIITAPDQAVVIMEERGEILEENSESEYRGEDGDRQPDSGISTLLESSPLLSQRPTNWIYGQSLVSAWSRARRTLKAMPHALKGRPRTLKAGNEGQNCLLWWHNLAQCNVGELSMACVQANNLMEDHCRVESSPTLGTFVGIFDGHSGPEAARFTAEHLFPNLQSEATSSWQDVSAETIRKAFLDTDERFIAHVEKQWSVKPQLAAVGSCCLVGIVCQRTLFIANLGDSRAVLGKVGLNGQITPEQLSREHNASHESVRQELRAQHPDDPHIVVFKHNVWRVKGIITVVLILSLIVLQYLHPCSVLTQFMMQVSRTIGDAYLKHQRFNKEPLHSKFRLREPFSQPILSANPSIISRSLQPSDRFIIFASDGLWEHLSNEEAIEIVHKHGRTLLQEAARKHEMRYSDLKKIDRGVRRHFHDDITVVVLFIDHGLSVKDHAQGSSALSISVPSSTELWALGRVACS